MNSKTAEVGGGGGRKTAPYKKIFLLFVGGGLLTPTVIGCGGEAPPPPPGTPVTVAEVTTADVPQYIETIGNVTAVASVDVVPQVTGTVMQIHFAQGSEVKAGDLLLSIDPGPYEAELKQAQGALEQSRAQLTDDEAQLRRAQQLAREDFVSKQALESLKARVDQRKGEIQGNEGRVQRAQIDLERTSVRAPISGLTSWLKVDEGNVVSANSPNPLVTIRSLDDVYIDFDLAEKFIVEVRKAFVSAPLKVQVSLISDNSIEANADLLLVDNQIQPGSGTVRLRGKLKNEGRKFWPGQLVKTRLILAIVPAQTLVPEQAVQLSQQGHYVFVVKPDKTAELRPVEIGQPQAGGFRGITKGLSQGEKVVLTGHLLLAPGAPVMELPPPGATPPPPAGEQKA